MIKFTVTAITETGVVKYDAIGAHCCDVLGDAVDRFGVCAISVVAK